jgi:plastocyanin
MKKRYFLSAAVFTLSMVLAACASTSSSNSPAGKQPQPTDTPAAGVTTVDVAISGFAFSPVEITVKAGTIVRWTNNDSVTHTVVADSGDWASGDLAQGGIYSRVFDAPGTYTYHCGVHPSMKGTIIVTA